MSAILGKKLGMTRIFQDDGHVIPITVVECAPNEVTQIKTAEKDGYPALVLGFSKLRKPMKTRQFYHMKEFKITAADAANYKKGDQVTVESMKDIKEIKITAVSKGRGFAGVIKRWNFKSGPGGHGSHHHREPGSSGCRAKPGRVQRGKKYPGRMGTDRVSVRTQVISIDSAKNIICIKGPIPGPIGGLVEIQRS